MSTNPDYKTAALAFLTQELGSRAPQSVGEPTPFDEQPLDGEGLSAVLSFDLPPANGVVCATDYDPRHYVVVGETEPNYFPVYQFSPDEAYSVHLGTRFLLQMQARGLDLAAEPEGSREQMRAFIKGATPNATLESDELVSLFQVTNQHFAVYRLSLNGETVYFVGLDCPPGFYRLIDLPPQVVLRLHLGQLVRLEAQSGEEDETRESAG